MPKDGSDSAMERARRTRVALVDLDWSDLDALAELVRAPGVSIRLVTGARADDPGVRLAELCELRHSTELGDLARERLDWALIGGNGSRRDGVERVLAVLGTPLEPIGEFVRRGCGEGKGTEAVEAPGTDAMVTLADELPVAAHVDSADGVAASAETAFEWPWNPEPATAPDDEPTIAPLPGPDDLYDLERMLEDWAAGTHAASAALHHVVGDGIERLCRIGPEDTLLDELVERAHRTWTAHSAGDGDTPGARLRGAWPLEGGGVCAILAVAGADAEAATVWPDAAEALARAWDDRAARGIDPRRSSS
jgi:hypothetical protein